MSPVAKKILHLANRVLTLPSIRYSPYFKFVRDIDPREKMLETAMDFAVRSELEGDYLEFGVSGGKSFIMSFHLAQMKNLRSMKFYAFDSFQGLPKIQGIDAEGYRQFSKKQFGCDVDTFKTNISKKGVDLNKVEIVPGWFDEVLNEETKKKLPVKKASIVLVDCDLYESTVPVLDFITDYVQDGTVLIFDDWFCFRGNPNRGEQRAFREWLKKNPKIGTTEWHKFGWHGNSFIIHPETASRAKR
jgi:O-methyltransferase